jgi:hypothetical protein
MTTLYQIAPVAPHKTPFRLLAKRLAGNGTRRVVLLERFVVLAVAGLLFVAIRSLHLWEARWR